MTVSTHLMRLRALRLSGKQLSESWIQSSTDQEIYMYSSRRVIRVDGFGRVTTCTLLPMF